MNRTLFLVCVFILLTANAYTQEEQRFALIELFTSEGCSSCPPADAFLLELTELAKSQQKPIYTLGFHVDYWNYLNWVDEYSQSSFSDRQRTYAKILKSKSVYTPQIIVNGKHEFVGTNRNLAIEYIEKSLVEEAPVILKAEAIHNKENIEISYRVNQTHKDYILNCAVVENGLSNRILSGENAGRMINHANVVRGFESAPLIEAKGKLILAVPSKLKMQNASIILYVQNTLNMEILAAQELKL